MLQVRDFPQELYDELSRVAEAEHRSIAQETIVLLKKALAFRQERQARRSGILREIREMDLGDTSRFPDPALLIREDRDR